MATDNFPATYIYLSQRLLRERYQQHVAQQPDHRLAPQFRPPLFTFGLEQRHDPDNPFWLARQVTNAVRDLTGSLSYPGPYVRAEMPITWSVLPVFGGRYRVAWLSGIAEEPEGSVFVALVGSLHNYIGVSYPEMDQALRGWWPSSAEGLRGILKAYSDEEEDPADLAQRPADVDPQELVRTAYTISTTLGQGYQIGHGDMELLFQILEHVPEANSAGQAAYIGTPLWVRTAPPRAFGSHSTPSDRKLQELAAPPGGDVVGPSARDTLWSRVRRALR